MNLRIAQPDEADSITALINLAFQVEKFFVDGDRIGVAEVHSLFQKGWFLVIDTAGELSGCVYIEPRGSHGYLGLLSIHPQRQGTGLGARLVAAAEEHARAQSLAAMDLNIVNVREDLPPFYRKLGYVETGTAPFPPEVPTKIPCHFICMSKTFALE